jgi:SAM-dependent methyltransferase
MVPLLANAIEASLNNYAAHAEQAATCLDVGCGGQPLHGKLRELGYRYSSLDVEQNAAGTVEHIGAIDRELPPSIRNLTFDLVVCTEVLEHVAHWPDAFANLASLLKPGGKLLITCPHIWVPHEEPFDFFRPTDWALQHHGKQVGLKALVLRRLGDGYDVLGTVLAAVRVQAPSGQPWLWVLAGPLSLIRKLALAVLSIRFTRHLLALPTPLYLSTLAVFEKPKQATP